MRPSIKRIREIARIHCPWGWQIDERGEPEDYFAEFRDPSHNPSISFEEMKVIAYANFETEIIMCRPIICRKSLYIFLHECGHVNLQHGRNTSDTPSWEEEYEAERYAIDSMRAAGIPVPREVIRAAKHFVRACINSKSNDETVPTRIYRWAHSSGR